jgi:NADH-quinone oxidoreductase subunit M
MGTYGLLRFVLPLFPDVIGQAVVPIMVLSVFGILYGGIVAAVQPDVKKLVAYSSVAHMGFVMLGIFSLTHDGIMGGSVQQLAHGISTGALFLLIGLLYERRHTRLFSDYGGLKAQMPIFSTLFLIVMLSSLGVPGFNGFIGEFLALKGAFDLGMTGQYNMTVLLPAIAATGVIIAAVYLLLMFMKVFYGPNTNPENQRLKDLKPKEIVMVGMLVVFIFWGGLYPNTFFKPMEASAHAVRLMAINPAGARPQWAEANQEISSTGSLVEVERSADNRSFEVIKEISPARLKFEKFDPMLQPEVIPQ